MARKKSKRRDDDEDDDDDDLRSKPKAKSEPGVRSDAYVGLLAISLIALIAGIALMQVDFDEISTGAAPLPSVSTSEDGLGLLKAAPKS